MEWLPYLCMSLQRSAFCAFDYLLVILPPAVGPFLPIFADVDSCWQVAPLSLAAWTRSPTCQVANGL